MSNPPVIKKMYVVTRDEKGHLHHYVSSKARIHSEIILEFDIDLDKQTLVQKGFILEHHRIKPNYDIRKPKKKSTKRNNGT